MEVCDKYKDMRCCKFCNERLTCNDVIGTCGCEDLWCEFITKGGNDHGAKLRSE